MSLLESAIGLLAPPICLNCGAEGATLCISCSSSKITFFGERCWRCGAISDKARTCPSCRHAGALRSVWIATVYDGVAKNLLQKYKYGQQRVAAQSIARLMKEALLLFNEPKSLGQANYLVIPIPTATIRVRQRGFDHSYLLARIVARQLQLQLLPALRRLGQSRQVGTPRSLRLIQPQGNYITYKKDKIQGRNVLLIDDVVTTGATLKAASKTLREAGATHVDALMFAKRL